MRPRPISADALDYQPASYLDNPGIRRYRVASLCVSAALRRGWSGDTRCFGFILKSFRTPACNDAFTAHAGRSEEHTSELQSLMRISYAVFCLKKKNNTQHYTKTTTTQSKSTDIISYRH